MWIRICYSAALISLSSPVAAEGWAGYSTSSDGTAYYLSAETLSRQGSALTVWILEDYSKNKKEQARSAKKRLLVDCDNQTVTVMSFVFYAPDESIIASKSLKSFEQEADDIVPGSTAAALAKIICR